MQTIAVYKESQVKVYSITERCGLALYLLSVPASQMDKWGQKIAELEDRLRRFELVTCQACDRKTARLHLLLDSRQAKIAGELLLSATEISDEAAVGDMQKVDVVYLHGPHFQDRYGIVDTAFEPLLKRDITLLVTGCAGTSMYLVTPEGQGSICAEILRETFLIPT